MRRSVKHVLKFIDLPPFKSCSVQSLNQNYSCNLKPFFFIFAQIAFWRVHYIWPLPGFSTKRALNWNETGQSNVVVNKQLTQMWKKTVALNWEHLDEDFNPFFAPPSPTYVMCRYTDVAWGALRWHGPLSVMEKALVGHKFCS